MPAAGCEGFSLSRALTHFELLETVILYLVCLLVKDVCIDLLVGRLDKNFQKFQLVISSRWG